MKNAGIIFKRTLWDSRTGILAWGIGLGLLALAEVMMYPQITQAFSGIADLLESPLYRAILGESADAAAFATPYGYVAMYVLALVPLYMAVYAVILGLGITAGEEERGTMDVLLGTPIPRWQVIVEKFAALVVILCLILLLDGLGAWIGVLLTPEMQSLTPLRILEGTIAMVPVTLVMAAMALFFSTVLRSRSLAAGVTGAIIIVSYFVNNLATVAQDVLGTIRYASFFNYFSPIGIMRDGLMWGDFLIVLVIALALFGLSLVAFQRRDLAV
jgi:ABC-2 type transport system permease protein